jgi:predicted aspartyl protease
MPCQPRVLSLALSIIFLASAACAQNGSGSTPGPGSQPAPQSPGVVIHMGSVGKGTVQTVPTAPPPTTSGTMPTLAAANQLFGERKIPEALAKYQAVVKADPKVIPAQVGLLRCYLMLQKLDDAQAAAMSAVAILPSAPQVLTTAADVQFRAGKLPEAERLYSKAITLYANDPEPYIGLARVYKAESLYGRAYENLKRAHEIAPNNGPVQMVYFHSLPQADQVPALESFLGTPNLNPQMVHTLQQYMMFLKKNAAAPVHACKLAANVQQTDTKLNPIARAGMVLGAVGLNVKINKQEVHLALDTGATGILLGRAASEKIGLQRLAYQPIVGVGDAGTQGGFTAVADRIRIGDLEFQDCVVKVTDQATPVTGQDGLIGADVFSSYLIDIDIPSAKLRLSPLPQRPNEVAAPPTLETMSDSEDQGGDASPAAKGTSPLSDLPKDAYVAPALSSWTKVYRFHSLLLVPTLVDRTGPMLFLIDTGSFSNVLSTRAAKQVTKVQLDTNMQVRGMNGNVSQVYSADKATLQFGRYEQQNQDMVTIDLSAVTRQTGAEVSGILGFKMLRILQLKIDYRDGLVDFIYDPKHLPKQVRVGD